MYITTKVPDHQYDLEIKEQCQIYLKSILRLVTLTPLSFFDGGCSYLAQ